MKRNHSATEEKDDHHAKDDHHHNNNNKKALPDKLVKSQDYIDVEERYGAHNYHPLPVVLERGQGVYMWDVEGKRYYDFLSAYSAINHGHCHPRMVKCMVEQCCKLTLTSRAFHNNVMAPFTKFVTEYFGYDMVLPMNTGVEAGETAVKATRKWGYMVKKIPENQAIVIFASNNFWGRSIAACSSSTDPDCYQNYGPFTPGFEIIPYDDIPALEEKLKNPNVAGVYLEPIQGEAGVKVPADGYLKKVRELTKAKNVLFIADEIQTGLGRTGKLLACDYEGVKPDMIVLAKALSGGMMPVSVVLGSQEVLGCFKPGTHGSTYGGNPLACKLAMEALTILKEEKLVENSFAMGNVFRDEVKNVLKGYKWVKDVRGKGLLNAIEIAETSKVTAWEICLILAEKGLLAKPTHDTIIRLAPPLVITREQVIDCARIIKETFAETDKKQ